MGTLFVTVAAVLWGLMGPVTRIALAEGLTPLEIAFWRGMLAGGLFAVHAVVIQRPWLQKRDVPMVIAFGLTGVAGLLATYSLAVEAGGAALAAILLYTAPVWVALFSVLFLAERMTGRKLAALALATLGVAGIALSTGGGSIRLTAAGLGWGLASGLAYALYYLFGKRYFERYATATLFMYALPAAALLILPAVRFHPKSAAAWGALAFLAIVPTYTSYVFYSAGLKRIEATRAATVATIEPVVAAFAAFLMWNERLSAAGYACAALVLFGVLLTAAADRPAETATEPPHP
ncbi:DMT family transporter [Longimicrobium terrae]|uniref:DME family drug/metabolite transporter n=1 Tax=Longimicrobium terrae TaxID=1639882 RepID=A0A841GXZ2_9BACT|nr:EamA family transporter [Longimicrobium terrae]MBB4636230.1 DME family drug/metabolite transporter [Longimicrobium terrae]MBB6070625.1 DME family drug/metabolite transporter [Longimicrobium terrae]NNC29610.1 EamA family transporter [Longimicrobium terrae]